MGDISNTQYFRAVQEKKLDVREVLEDVYFALTEKGYNPINQIVGYIMSGDPTYITSHKSARSLIMKVERDEILEELMKVYVETRLKLASKPARVRFAAPARYQTEGKRISAAVRRQDLPGGGVRAIQMGRRQLAVCQLVF